MLTRWNVGITLTWWTYSLFQNKQCQINKGYEGNFIYI